MNGFRPIRIAITGGPSGGKTTVIETLARDLKKRVTIIPEAASILYKGGFPRYAHSDAKIHTQKVIYTLQVELEDLLGNMHPNTIMICDRGSLDGLAYWPFQESDFFKKLNTTREKEMARYDWVLHLDTADHDSYETSNPLRTESFSEALALNKRIHKAWQGHPQRIIISQSADFYEKLLVSIKVIHAMAAGDSIEQITQLLPCKQE